MGTKTISIMDDVYELLARNKLEDESFSDEIRRILANRKDGDLKKYFGIISEEEGEAMLKNLEKIKAINIKIQKAKIKDYWGI